MHQSIPSLNIPPGDPRGFAHFSCPWGRVFAPLFCPGMGVLNQSKSSIILKKSAIFAKQMSSSLFHMFIYARSAQCNSGSIYNTLTNTQHIRIYPGKLKPWSKFHRIQDVYMANMPKKTKLYSCFLLTVQSTLSHLQSPPEQMQSQRNYGSFLSKSQFHGVILFTMLAQNRPKSKRQCF